MIGTTGYLDLLRFFPKVLCNAAKFDSYFSYGVKKFSGMAKVKQIPFSENFFFRQVSNILCQFSR